MDNVLFSIKPQYVEKIFSGEKCFEFRKKACKREVSRMIVYATKPIGRIVGEVVVSDVITLPPEELWAITSGRAGITYDKFKDYLDGNELACAYCLEAPMMYSHPITLEMLGISCPPQSFRYLSDKEYEKILSFK